MQLVLIISLITYLSAFGGLFFWYGSNKLELVQGEGSAQTIIGNMYRMGIGVSEDYGKAAAWYRKGAERGHVHAQHDLGSMYHFGIGVTQDDREAAILYRKAAEQGHARAQGMLGIMYYWGRCLQQDYKEAVSWSRMAAEQGYYIGQSILGRLYAEGSGVPQSNILARMWFGIAVSNGSESASDQLADIEANMTPDEIAEAESLAQECLANDYKGCEGVVN